MLQISSVIPIFTVTFADVKNTRMFMYVKFNSLFPHLIGTIWKDQSYIIILHSISDLLLNKMAPTVTMDDLNTD